MSLTSSMYSGISGLFSHSRSMAVIGNNLANTSTIGFKAGTMHFEDVFYTQINVSNGIGQVGNGSTVSSISTSFAQGPNEASTEATHVAVGGNGFFLVENPATNARYYTRAGNFEFDKDGFLVDPAGNRVQGWGAQFNEMTNTTETVGAIGDLKLESNLSPASPTTAMSIIANLQYTSSTQEKASDATNPAFALFSEWDGASTPPIGDDRYSFQHTMKVYDESGGSHDVTVYFDPAEGLTNTNGDRVVEYIVTVPPTEDGRSIGGTSLAGTRAAGLLMAGTLTFDASGSLKGQSAFTPKSTTTPATPVGVATLSQWTPAELSANGRPKFTANFTGQNGSSFTDDANAKEIELDFGANNGAATWTATPNAAAIGTNATNIPNFSDFRVAAEPTKLSELASTTFDDDQDGYGTGFLQGIEIDKNGVIRARYSNGQNRDLFMLTLANFRNLQGLKQEGANLFSETLESGEARTGRPGTADYGNVWAKTLEQSNVDVAREMVRLITTQRGYQANSKIITTADTMLQEAIQLKR